MVELWVDAEIWQGDAFLSHPLVNTATLVLSKAELERFFELTGHTLHLFSEKEGSKMKIAFAGAGYIINIHAKAAKTQKDVELAAVVEKFSDKAGALAQKFRIKKQYETVEQMLKAGGVDALVIGTPNFLHAPQAIAALKAGVHVMVEKPMAMNVRRS